MLLVFLRAEAALRGWDTEKTPKAYYEAGIRLSFEQLGAKNVEDYLVSTNTPVLRNSAQASNPNGKFAIHF